MRILGIDFGESKVGLAACDAGLSPYPLGVLKFRGKEDLLEKILRIVKEEGIEKVVVGISEGKMAEEVVLFADKLKKVLPVPLVLQDETLTTYYAKSLSIDASINRKKRKKMEDAYAACLILESFVERAGVR